MFSISARALEGKIDLLIRHMQGLSFTPPMAQNMSAKQTLHHTLDSNMLIYMKGRIRIGFLGTKFIISIFLRVRVGCQVAWQGIFGKLNREIRPSRKRAVVSYHNRLSFPIIFPSALLPQGCE